MAETCVWMFLLWTKCALRLWRFVLNRFSWIKTSLTKTPMFLALVWATAVRHRDFCTRETWQSLEIRTDRWSLWALWCKSSPHWPSFWPSSRHWKHEGGKFASTQGFRSSSAEWCREKSFPLQPREMLQRLLLTQTSTILRIQQSGPKRSNLCRHSRSGRKSPTSTRACESQSRIWCSTRQSLRIQPNQPTLINRSCKSHLQFWLASQSRGQGSLFLRFPKDEHLDRKNDSIWSIESRWLFFRPKDELDSSRSSSMWTFLLGIHFPDRDLGNKIVNKVT